MDGSAVGADALLGAFGFRNLGKIHHNLNEAALYEMALSRGEGEIAKGGPLVVKTGKHTGRSASDKFIVRHKASEDNIWWDNAAEMTPEQFDALKEDMLAHAEGEELFVQDLFGGADARHRLSVRIVTQFGFDAEKFTTWAEGLSTSGIDLPVHLGVAGPAKLTTLVKFAAMCGVGNSISFLKKRMGAVLTLASGFDPDEIVNPIEARALQMENSPIAQIHVFPFGGVKKSADWLRERGTWES